MAGTGPGWSSLRVRGLKARLRRWAAPAIPMLGTAALAWQLRQITNQLATLFTAASSAVFPLFFVAFAPASRTRQDRRVVPEDGTRGRP